MSIFNGFAFILSISPCKAAFRPRYTSDEGKQACTDVDRRNSPCRDVAEKLAEAPRLAAASRVPKLADLEAFGQMHEPAPVIFLHVRRDQEVDAPDSHALQQRRDDGTAPARRTAVDNGGTMERLKIKTRKRLSGAVGGKKARNTACYSIFCTR